VAALVLGSVVGSLVVGVLLLRRLRMSSDLVRVLSLARNIIKDRVIPIDVEINQDITVSLSGTTLPSDLRMAIRMEEALDIEAIVPVRTSIPLDCVVDSTVLKYGRIKIPIQGTIPINVDIPVQLQALVRSETLHVRLTEPLRLDLPEIVVPLRAKIRVNIPLHLPDVPELRRIDAKK
jgi:hypothetical protein